MTDQEKLEQIDKLVTRLAQEILQREVNVVYYEYPTRHQNKVNVIFNQSIVEQRFLDVLKNWEPVKDLDEHIRNYSGLDDIEKLKCVLTLLHIYTDGSAGVYVHDDLVRSPDSAALVYIYKEQWGKQDD